MRVFYGPLGDLFKSLPKDPLSQKLIDKDPLSKALGVSDDDKKKRRQKTLTQPETSLLNPSAPAAAASGPTSLLGRPGL